MKWKKLQPAEVASTSYADPRNAVFVDAVMKVNNCSREGAIALLEKYDNQCQYWRNDLYQVQTRRCFNEQFKEEMVHINIRRIDGAPIFDWRHRQLIKNQLVGEECEAFEVYPAESRLSDTANKYHLWAFVDPRVRLPVQVNAEDVRDVVEEEVKSPPGARQRRITGSKQRSVE